MSWRIIVFRLNDENYISCHNIFRNVDVTIDTKAKRKMTNHQPNSLRMGNHKLSIE